MDKMYGYISIIYIRDKVSRPGMCFQLKNGFGTNEAHTSIPRVQANVIVLAFTFGILFFYSILQNWDSFVLCAWAFKFLVDLSFSILLYLET